MAINDWRDVPEIKTDEQAVEMFGPAFRGVVSAAEKMGGRAAVYVVGVDLASSPDRTGMVFRREAEETDDALRARILREMTREGTTRTPEMRDPDPRIQEWADAAERIAARPMLRIYDADGCVLAEGPMQADKARGGKARLHYRIQVATTGTAERWTVSAPGFEAGGDIGDLNIGTRALGSGHYIVGTLDVMAFGLGVSGPRPRACAGRGAPEAKGSAMLKTPTCEKCAPAIRPPTPEDERAAREAPLVALVNAVPEGLNPIGWRAAVLGIVDALKINDVSTSDVRWRVADEKLPDRGGSVERQIRENAPESTALRLYRRAIAPHKAPPPERRQGGKALRLTVDDGRDE